jgi:hypothetical protein
LTYDVRSNSPLWTVKANDEMGRGEDYEVSKAGTSSYDKLFSQYTITKTENVILENFPNDESDDQIVTKYLIRFTNETSPLQP